MKVFIAGFLIVGLVVGGLATLTLNTHALIMPEEKREWTTYFNPIFKFTMEYHKSNIGKAVTVLWDKNQYDMMISPSGCILQIYDKNSTNLKTFVQNKLEYDLSKDENVTTMKDVTPVIYSNFSGYEYVTFDNEIENVYTNVIMDTGNYTFSFWISDPKEDYDLTDFKRSINSIAFLN